MIIPGSEYRQSRNGGSGLCPANDINQWKYINMPEHWNFPFEIANLCKENTLVIQACLGDSKKTVKIDTAVKYEDAL